MIQREKGQREENKSGCGRADESNRVCLKHYAAECADGVAYSAREQTEYRKRQQRVALSGKVGKQHYPIH